MCRDLCLTVWFNLYFPVKEFEEEIDGEIHHRHHLLSTVALIASPGYDMAAEDPLIFSDPESEPFTRAWPNQDIPRSGASPAEVPAVISDAFIKDLQLQHDTAVKVLKCLGVDACRRVQL